MIAVEDLTGYQISWRFCPAFALDSIDYCNGLARLVQESNEYLLGFAVRVRYNEPFLSHFFIASKDECIQDYVFDALHLLELFELMESNQVLKNADSREFEPIWEYQVTNQESR